MQQCPTKPFYNHSNPLDWYGLDGKQTASDLHCSPKPAASAQLGGWHTRAVIIDNLGMTDNWGFWVKKRLRISSGLRSVLDMEDGFSSRDLKQEWEEFSC